MAINMYTIDSVILYEYAWCLGVDTVTTNNCQLLSSHVHNYLHEVRMIHCKSYSIISKEHAIIQLGIEGAFCIAINCVLF